MSSGTSHSSGLLTALTIFDHLAGNPANIFGPSARICFASLSPRTPFFGAACGVGVSRSSVEVAGVGRDVDADGLAGGAGAVSAMGAVDDVAGPEADGARGRVIGVTDGEGGAGPNGVG